MKPIRIVVFFLLVTGTFSQAQASQPSVTPTNLNVIVQSMEQTGQLNPAHSRPYEVTRQYKVFRADDKQPTAEITAQISFSPPRTRTFNIVHTSGNARGEKIVRDILAQEIQSTAEGHRSDISQMNYDFILLRQENFGFFPEYVLRIVPKRKEEGLLLGQIWVDAKTFRIRRIQGVPVKSPSLWIKDIHITMQFAEVSGMWIPVSLDAVANVRLLGRYTLTGLNVEGQDPISSKQNP